MALERFGSVQDVSIFFFVLGILGVGMSLGVPWLVRQLARRGTFWLGAVSGVISMLLFMHNELWSFCAGMALHLFAASCIDVTLNLYLMEHIRRKDFGRFEPVRMFFLAFSWSIGPFLGVYLRNAIDPMAPFFVGAIVVLLLGAYFFYLRFSDKPIPSTKPTAVTNSLPAKIFFATADDVGLSFMCNALRLVDHVLHLRTNLLRHRRFRRNHRRRTSITCYQFRNGNPPTAGHNTAFWYSSDPAARLLWSWTDNPRNRLFHGDTLAGSDIDTARSVICRFVRLGGEYTLLPSGEILGTLRNGHGIRELSFHLKPYFSGLLFGRPRHLPTGGSIHLHRIWNAGRKLANALYSHANAVKIESLPDKCHWFDSRRCDVKKL